MLKIKSGDRVITHYQRFLDADKHQQENDKKSNIVYFAGIFCGKFRIFSRRILPFSMIVIFIVSAAFSAYAEEELQPDFDGLPKPVQPEPPFYPGEALRVRITADIKPGWKLYSLIDQGEKAPPPTAFSFGDTSLQPAKVRLRNQTGQGICRGIQIDLYSHKRRAFFYQNFQIPPDHPAGNFSIPFTVSYVVCSFRICMPPADEEMVFSYTVSAGSPRPERTEQNFNTDAQPADVMKADINQTVSYHSRYWLY
ncbi:hypothetical protein CHS0354_027385 [Potamilus streckersoni]|uniref:Thiol:disulfide interchange protein DsbD N-terminal domain-containing protein n=1 Tax=Potamilus streckersoni TaxID=2493646 RepID=A0AAE0W0S8_9BIVA|nr:hypothetical protein CHS0354_027385 [Potamilus streckersoni]